MVGRTGDALFLEYLVDSNCGERLRLVVVGLADTVAVADAPNGFL